MCIRARLDNTNSNFAITNLILSMVGKFTFEDVWNLVNQYSLTTSENAVRNSLNRLRENDYLDEIGIYYEVIPKEKSVRWGWY